MIFILELLAVGGVGLFVYRDYKNGFPALSSMYQRGCGILRIAGRKEDTITRVDRLVAQHAKGLALLRDSVATIKANAEQTARRMGEQGILAVEWTEVAEEAARAGNDEALTLAAVAKVEAEKRTKFFAGHEAEQRRVLKILEDQMAVKEMEFDGIRTKAETARVVHQITEAKKNLYLLSSNVEAEVGLTTNGQLEQLLLGVEHEDLKTDALLEMVQDSGKGRIIQFRQQYDVRKAIEEVKQKIALPPAPPEIEAASEEE